MITNLFQYGILNSVKPTIIDFVYTSAPPCLL
jgi:hypothetical protein